MPKSCKGVGIIEILSFMKKTEIVPLQTETEKNEQLSPISFDELSEILGGGKPTKGQNTPKGSCGGLVCWC